MSAIERRNIKEIKSRTVNEILDLPQAQFAPGDTHTPIEIANQLWQFGFIKSYMDFEFALRRRKNPDIFFIAAPAEYLSKHLAHADEYILKYPVIKPGNLFSAPKFGLIIEAEGVQKAVLQLKDLETTYMENLRRLKSTGILYPKSIAHKNIVFSR